MDRDDNRKMDEGLQGNEKIEQAIRELQQAPSGEELAHTLTVVRRRMKEGGQFIVAVEPPRGDGKIQIQAIQTADGQQWWAAFTSFEEELKGSGSVMSTFLSDMEKLFTAALGTEGINGVIVNPWNRTLMMDRGHIILDVAGAERAGMTVEDLLAKFKSGAGKALDNDRILLSE